MKDNFILLNPEKSKCLAPHFWSQFSTISPGTLLNSFSLFVIKVLQCERTIAVYASCNCCDHVLFRAAGGLYSEEVGQVYLLNGH